MEKLSNKGNKIQQVIVYIDGYNLYYGMRQAYYSQYKWLDLQGLAQSFLTENMELVAVKYFTAITKSTSKVRHRQEIYLKALEIHCERLKFYKGRFLSKTKTCRKCGHQYTTFEEKKTDVNIACQILNDAYLDLYDVVYIVSGDSDLVPPVEIVKKTYPNKRILIAHPPKRKSAELCRIADSWFSISRQKLRQNQLPEIVTTPHGGKLTRPPIWE